MFNYKDLSFKEVGWSVFIFLHLRAPESYEATTISEFNRERGGVEPTKIWKVPLTCQLFYNRALIVFPAASYNQINEDKGLITDSTSHLEVYLKLLDEEWKSDLETRTKLVKPLIVYDPQEDISFLFYYEREMPEEESDESFSAVPCRGRLGLAGSY